MKCLAAVIAVLVLLATKTHVYAQSSEAERLYFEGQNAYDEKRYDGALVAWQRSYQISHLPALLFNIAQAYRLRGLAGDCTKASQTYQKFIQLDPKSSQRTAAEAFVVELAPCTTGSPTTIAPAPNLAPATVAPPQPGSERPRAKSTVPYVVGGVSLGVVAAGAYFGYRASTLASEVSDACAKGCEWSTVADRDAAGRRAEQTQWILLGVGGAGLVSAGVLYWMGSRSSNRVAIAPAQHGGALISWSGAW